MPDYDPDSYPEDFTHEEVPLQPKCPQLYANRPDNDPMKIWFVNRGARFEHGRYVIGSMPSLEVPANHDLSNFHPNENAD